MRLNKNTLITLALLIVVAALYRVLSAPYGYAPQLAMALFGGSVIRDKRLAFAFPIFSIFISDLLYHLLYINGLTTLQGFYEGQLLNYVLFAGLTAIGFLMKKITVLNVALFSLIVCTVFFLVSNFFVWYGNGGYSRPHTFAGMMMAYEDGLPFFLNSIKATLLFSAILFGSWKLLGAGQKQAVAA